MRLSLKGIKFRLVEIKDAEFIYKLRTNNKLNKYLSQISGSIEDQKKWIREYKKREKEKKEYYFVIMNENGDSIGLIRVYNIKNNYLEWGSWILNPEKSNPILALKSILLIYKFIFEKLKYEKANFDVRKENKEVVFFHKSYGAKIINENDIDYFFEFTKEDYELMKEKYKRFYK
jgi:RimJ/RimL family protein N-acetyltransferase